jgi:mono/diheme cytochrome c family protein
MKEERHGKRPLQEQIRAAFAVLIVTARAPDGRRACRAHVRTRGKGGCMIRNVICGAIIVVMAAAAASAQDAKAKGEKVYTDQKCSLCHSIGGKGNAKGPLDEVGSKLTPDEIHAWIVDAKGMTEKAKATRKPVMKQYNLPKDDVDALVAYLSTLKKK